MEMRGTSHISPAERLQLQSVLDPVTGCRIMTKKPCGSDGYVQVRIGGKLVLAHRAAFQLAGREIPEGFELDHTCNTPACINVDHLEVVSKSENNLRKFRRGRGGRVVIKLNFEKAEQIRALVRQGHTQEEVAGMFGVSRTSVNAVVNFRRWAS